MKPAGLKDDGVTPQTRQVSYEEVQALAAAVEQTKEGTEVFALECSALNNFGLKTLYGASLRSEVNVLRVTTKR